MNIVVNMNHKVCRFTSSGICMIWQLFKLLVNWNIFTYEIHTLLSRGIKVIYFYKTYFNIFVFLLINYIWSMTKLFYYQKIFSLKIQNLIVKYSSEELKPSQEFIATIKSTNTSSTYNQLLHLFFSVSHSCFQMFDCIQILRSALTVLIFFFSLIQSVEINLMILACF